MPYDRFLIAPSNSGIQTDLRPWLIPDDAFVELKNMYVFRGRITKRFGGIYMGGSALSSRFRIPVGTTDGSGDSSGTVPGDIFQPGQMFSIGTEIYTVYINIVGPQTMLDTGATVTKTFDISNGNFVFVGAPINSTVYWYPAQPVMGLTVYEVGAINNQPSYGFDTQFAYLFTGGAWTQSTGPLWHGTNLNFFWTYNWTSNVLAAVVLFVTNFQAAIGAASVSDDPIWTLNGTTWTAQVGGTANGFYFLPAPGTPPTPQARYTGPYVKTALIIIPFKNRLLLLYTIENNNPNGNGTAGTNTVYPQRCRFSINGSPFAQNSWYEPNQSDSSGTANGLSNAAGAGYIDATTEEKIVSAEFIKDRLIVYFEESTWEIVYTGNEANPFYWQKINTELGSMATFSTIAFDKYVLSVGRTGIHACSGSNVERIDSKIPEQIFEIKIEDSAPSRIQGVRDYYNEMIYWTFVEDNELPIETYPNQVLVYNYKNGAWAYNDDCITAFGYFEQQMDVTWETAMSTWEEYTDTWVDGVLEAQFKQIIAGNQQGFVFVVNDQESRNAAVMQITQMANVLTGIQLTIYDHTLAVKEGEEDSDFVSIEGAVGIVLAPAGQVIFQVVDVIDANNVIVSTPNGASFTGAYQGGGFAARVSNPQLITKQWNPYITKGRNIYLQRIDFGVTKTSAGQVLVDYSPSSSDLLFINDATMSGAILGNGILETSPYADFPLEQTQELLWHPIYFQTDGEFIQLYIYMTPTQLTTTAIAWSNFEIQGMVLWTQPTTNRLQ